MNPRSLLAKMLMLIMMLTLTLMPLPVQAQDGLTASYMLLDDTLTFRYPGEWMVEELPGISGFAVASNYSEALDGFLAGDVDLSGDDVIVVVVSPQTMFDAFAIDPEGPPGDIPREFTGMTLGVEIIELEYNGRGIAYASVTDDLNTSVVFGVEIGGGLSTLMLGGTAPGNEDAYMDTFIAIAQSLHDPAYPLDDGPGTSPPDDGALSQTFISEDGLLSFDYPRSYEAGQLYDLAMLSLLNGSVRVVIVPPDRVAQHVGSASPDAATAATSYLPMLDDRAGVDVGDVETIGVGARVEATHGNRDELLLAVDVGEGQVALVYASMPGGNRDRFEPTLLAIAETITFSGDVGVTGALPLRETYTNDSTGFSVQYPTGWVAVGAEEDLGLEQEFEVVVLTNTQDAYDYFVNVGDGARDGDFVAVIFGPAFFIEIGSTYTTPREVLDDYQIDLSGDVSAPIDVTLNGRRAAYVLVDNDGVLGLVVAIEVAEGEFVLVAGASGGPTISYEDVVIPTTLAIASSISPDGPPVSGGTNGVETGDASAFASLMADNIASATVIHQMPTAVEWFTGLAFSSDGSQLAVASGLFGPEYAITIWDAVSGQEISVIDPEMITFDMAFSADNSQIVGVGGLFDEGIYQVRSWSLTTGQQQWVFEDPSDNLAWAMAVSPDGSQIASGGSDFLVHLTDMETGAEVWWAAGHDDGVSGVVFTPDGSQIISGGELGAIIVWNATNGREQTSWQAHRDGTNGIALSPSGTTLASVGEDGYLRLWDVESGAMVQEIRTGTPDPLGISFHPDGRLLTTGGDNWISVWDLETGTEVARLDDFTERVSHVQFSSNGRLLASGGYDDIVRVWAVPE